MSSPSLYAPREPIFPRRVSGYYRRMKWVILTLALGTYYITPWLRWDRGPNLSDQAVLIDIANRRIFFFWIEIWPHEFYFVAGLLIMAGLGLFLFTSALGAYGVGMLALRPYGPTCSYWSSVGSRVIAMRASGCIAAHGPCKNGA